MVEEGVGREGGGEGEWRYSTHQAYLLLHWR